MDDQISFSGKIDFLNFGEILQILGNNGSSGVLRIISKYADKPGLVYIDNGNPVDASDGSQQGLQALFSLFGWTDGRFEFREEPVKKKNVINKNRMEIILDGSRLVDDGHIKKLGPVTFEKKITAASDDEFCLPVIKGPFVDYMYVVDEEEFYEGDEIVIEGSYGNWMWVILEGMVEVSKKSDKGQVKILRLKEGAYVGSLASFLIEGNVRSASAAAATRVQLGMLDTQRLIGEYSKLSNDMRHVVNSLDKRLKQVSNHIVDAYCNRSKIKTYLKDKKSVIEQGKSDERLFRITNGHALVFRNTETGSVPMALLEKGDVFGNIPFLNIGHEPHTASVYASKELKIVPVDNKPLKAEHAKMSTAFKNILENLATSISVSSMVACEYQKRTPPASKK